MKVSAASNIAEIVSCVSRRICTRPSSNLVWLLNHKEWIVHIFFFFNLLEPKSEATPRSKECKAFSILIQNTQVIKRTRFDWTKQGNMCKFSRKSSFSSYVQHKQTTRANFRGSSRFQVTYTINTEKQTMNSTDLVSDARRLAEGKGPVFII